MTVSALSGPAINFGIAFSSSGVPNEYNEDRGPSLNDLGEGTLDPRPQFGYQPGQRNGSPTYGWPGCFGGPVVDFIPIALNTSGIAAAQSATAATGTMTLASSAASSSFRTISGFIPSTVAVSKPSSITVLMIDGYQGGVAVGQGSSSPILGMGCGFGTATTVTSSAGVVASPTIQLWNPLCMAGRCLSFGNSSNTSCNATFVVSGYDVYGMAMTQTLSGPSSAGGASSQVNTSKAFKYIQSIAFTNSSNGSGSIFVGTIDTFGFPLYVDHPSYVTMWLGPPSSATVITANAGFHSFGYGSSVYGSVPPNQFGSSLAAASSLGDVRGTYASSLATTGNTAASGSTGFRVVMNISPRVVPLATITPTSSGNWGLLGLPQV